MRGNFPTDDRKKIDGVFGGNTGLKIVDGASAGADLFVSRTGAVYHVRSTREDDHGQGFENVDRMLDYVSGYRTTCTNV